MQKFIQTYSPFLLFLSVFVFNVSAVFSGGVDISEPEIALWYNLIDADIHAVAEVLGDSYIEIEPSAVGSMADRLIWYKEGISLWIDNGRVAQLRLDSAVGGSVSGIRIGSQTSEVIQILGRPWIEADESLYYNLPWRGGPVRLRLIFVNSGLSEIYLYIVR